MADEQIIARRVTSDEFCNYMEKLEYIDGRIVTGPGIELFVGVKEFPESIRAFEEEKKREFDAAGLASTRKPAGSASK